VKIEAQHTLQTAFKQPPNRRTAPRRQEQHAVAVAGIAKQTLSLQAAGTEVQALDFAGSACDWNFS